MPETTVRVTLLEKSPHATAMTATAARTCYSANAPDAIVERWKSKPDDMIQTVDRVRAAGHHSTLEHNIYVFGVTGLSRSATHHPCPGWLRRKFAGRTIGSWLSR